MPNRKGATEWLVNFIDSILPGSPNKEIYIKRLGEMTDEEFHQFVMKIKSEEEYLHLVVPNGSPVKLSIRRNYKLAEMLGFSFFERLVITNQKTGRRNISNFEHLTVDLGYRRQVQMLETKISVADDNVHIDQRTNQPTGVSKASGISAPESQMLRAQGLTNSLLEFLKVRGGDSQAYNVATKLILRDGRVRLETINNLGTRAKSVEVSSTYLTGMHLKNNL